MNTDKFVRLPELREHLAICDKSLRRLIKQRIIPAYRPTSRLLLFKLSEVEASLARFRMGGKV